MDQFAEKTLSIEEREFLVEKYKHKFIDLQQYNLLWEGISQEKVDKYKISYQELTKFAEGITESYYFTYFKEGQVPNYKEVNRVSITKNVSQILKKFKKNPQDIYFFDDTFKWTIVSCHEGMDIYEEYHYLLIKE
jgi:hypothetical protein